MPPKKAIEKRFSANATPLWGTQVSSPADDSIREDMAAIGFTQGKVNAMMQPEMEARAPVVDGLMQPVWHASRDEWPLATYRPPPPVVKKPQDRGPHGGKQQRAASAAKSKKGQVYENFRLKKGSNWVLFDDERAFPERHTDIPEVALRYARFKAGNAKILMLNIVSEALRLQTTPESLYGNAIDYTNLGPRLVITTEGESESELESEDEPPVTQMASEGSGSTEDTPYESAEEEVSAIHAPPQEPHPTVDSQHESDGDVGNQQAAPSESDLTENPQDDLDDEPQITRWTHREPTPAAEPVPESSDSESKYVKVAHGQASSSKRRVSHQKRRHDATPDEEEEPDPKRTRITSMTVATPSSEHKGKGKGRAHDASNEEQSVQLTPGKPKAPQIPIAESTIWSPGPPVEYEVEYFDVEDEERFQHDEQDPHKARATDSDVEDPSRESSVDVLQTSQPRSQPRPKLASLAPEYRPQALSSIEEEAEEGSDTTANLAPASKKRAREATDDVEVVQHAPPTKFRKVSRAPKPIKTEPVEGTPAPARQSARLQQKREASVALASATPAPAAVVKQAQRQPKASSSKVVKKRSTSAAAAASRPASRAATPAAPPVKRGRGRPRKHLTPAEVKESSE